MTGPSNPDGHPPSDLALMDQALAQAMNAADVYAETAARILAARGEVQGCADLTALLREDVFERAPMYGTSICAAALMELGKIRYPAVSDAG